MRQGSSTCSPTHAVASRFCAPAKWGPLCAARSFPQCTACSSPCCASTSEVGQLVQDASRTNLFTLVSRNTLHRKVALRNVNTPVEPKACRQLSAPPAVRAVNNNYDVWVMIALLFSNCDIYQPRGIEQLRPLWCQYDPTYCHDIVIIISVPTPLVGSVKLLPPTI